MLAELPPRLDTRLGLAACQAEWKLIAATHNLLKLWRAGLAEARKAIPEPLAG